jgi:hypothetical protein
MVSRADGKLCYCRRVYRLALTYLWSLNRLSLANLSRLMGPYCHDGDANCNEAATVALRRRIRRKCCRRGASPHWRQGISRPSRPAQKLMLDSAMYRKLTIAHTSISPSSQPTGLVGVWLANFIGMTPRCRQSRRALAPRNCYPAYSRQASL